MTKQTRKFLSVLRATYRYSSVDTRKEIWAILSALRGPDNENTQDKDATTAIIRNEVFKGKAASLLAENMIVGEDSLTNRNTRASLYTYNHFSSHARKAFDVLNLKWDEVNK